MRKDTNTHADLVIAQPRLGERSGEGAWVSGAMVLVRRRPHEFDMLDRIDPSLTSQVWSFNIDEGSGSAKSWVFDPIARIRNADGTAETEAVRLADVLTHTWTERHAGQSWASAQRLVAALLLAAGLDGGSAERAWRWAVVMSGEPLTIFQRSGRWAAWAALVNDSLILPETERMTLYSMAEDILSTFVHPVVRPHIQEVPAPREVAVFVPEEFVADRKAKLLLCNVDGDAWIESFMRVMTDAIQRSGEDQAISTGHPHSVRVIDSAA